MCYVSARGALGCSFQRRWGVFHFVAASEHRPQRVGLSRGPRRAGRRRSGSIHDASPEGVLDDVGLGKTIEAGLVCQELIIRHRARRIVIVCPAALQEQWRDQMRDKFGLEFRIVDSDPFHRLRRDRDQRVNPGTIKRAATKI